MRDGFKIYDSDTHISPMAETRRVDGLVRLPPRRIPLSRVNEQSPRVKSLGAGVMGNAVGLRREMFWGALGRRNGASYAITRIHGDSARANFEARRLCRVPYS